MIIFDNVTKRYGTHTVLDGLSFTIKGEEFVSIVGPSGAGKSTLIHALIGMEKIDQGSITIDGYEINSMSPEAVQEYRRKIGVVFQDYKLLPHKTLYENVAFAMEVCEIPDEMIIEKVPHVLNVVGLVDKNDLFPVQLAGGEKQRLAIARALVHEPKLIIADEPTGNLDPKNAKEIIKLLMMLNKAGTTVILTTHNKGLVDYINRRVIFLDKGRIVSDVEEGTYDLSLLEAEVVDQKGNRLKLTEIHVD